MLENQTALVVDRSSDVRQYVASILERQFGCENLLQAATRDEAWAHLRAGTEHIDWIFYDWDLPDSDPEAFLAEVRKHPGSQGAAVLMMTRHRKRAELDEALDAGAVDFLIKPFTLSILLLKVRRLALTRERRGDGRLRVHTAHEVTIAITDKETLNARLLSISNTGCLTRAPLSLCRTTCIYENATIEINTDDGIMDLAGELVRVEHDRGPEPSREHVLAAFHFQPLPAESEKRLESFIAKLGPGQPASW